MPTPMMQKIHDEKGISISTLEKYWDEAKAIVAKTEGSTEGHWGLVQEIFKNKVEAHDKPKNESFLDLFIK